jgi:signal transduction histidine kinase/CheY-like chemotaxis protein
MVFLAANLAFGQTSTRQALEKGEKWFYKENKDSALYYANLAMKLSEEQDFEERFDASRFFCDVYFNFDYDSTTIFKLNQQLLEECLDQKDFQRASLIIRDLGSYLRRLGYYSEAHQAYQKLLALGQETDDAEMVAAAYNALGVVDYYTGNHFKALINYEKALQQYLGLKDTFLISKAYNNIAIIYKNQKDYPKAIEYYHKAIQMLDTTNGKNRNRLVNRWYNLSRAYKDAGNFDSAAWAIQFMMEIDREKASYDDLVHDLMLLAEVRMKAGNFQVALNLADSALRLTELHNLNEVLGLVYQKTGWIYEAMGSFDSTILFYERAEPYYQSSNFLAEKGEFYLNKARVFVATQQWDSAIVNASICREIFSEIRLKEFLADAHDMLYQSYKGKGNYAMALQFLEKHKAYEDSLFSEDKSIEIGRLQNQIQLSQQEVENQKLRNENLAQQTTIQQQYIFLLLIIAILVIAILLTLLFFRAAKIRKSLINRIKEQKDQIHHQAEKLRALDRTKTNFFTNISHDLRSPLTLIMGHLDLVMEDPNQKLSTESKNHLEISYRNSKKLWHMAEEIRDLTRLEAGKLKLKTQFVKIEPYLNLLVKMFSSSADQKNILLTFTSNVSDETLVKIDPYQFEKVIYNLLSNAVRFTAPGGNIWVILEKQDKEILIHVKDDGQGIDPQQIPYVFDRFYQSDNREPHEHEGLGIGLALSKEIVQLHHGVIDADSTPEKGSTFTITLPHDEKVWVSDTMILPESHYLSENFAIPRTLPLEQELSIQKMKDAAGILIVEDHREIRNFLKSIIGEKYIVYTANNGRDALKILKVKAIDLVVTDLMMPYMDGFELIDHLQKDAQLNKIPILIVSARTNEEDKLSLIEKGAEAILPKPFQAKELLLRVANILKRQTKVSNQKLLELYQPSHDAKGFEEEILKKVEQLILERIDDASLSVMDLADVLAASERKVFRLIKFQ